MPSETFTHQTTTSAPVKDVWSALDRPKTWEAIGGVDRVFDPIIDNQGRLQGFSFETVAAGKTYVGVARPHARVEGQTMAWDIQHSEVRGVSTVNLGQNDDITMVTVTIRIESAGLLSSMFFPIIARAVGKGLPEAVEKFAASFR